MPKCSLTHQKAEQRDFRHAVLSKPYKPVLCATTLGSPFFMWDKLLEGKGEKQNVPAVTGGGNSLEKNPGISSVPRRTLNSVSFHVWTVPGACPTKHRQ